MKSKSLFLLLLIIPFYIFTQTQIQDKLFYADSSEYNDLKLLYAEQEKVTPATVFPITAKEMINLLNNIDENKLSGAYVSLYTNLYDSLQITQKEAPGLAVGVALSTELYLQTNPQDFGGLDFDSRDDILDETTGIYPDTSVKSEYGHRLTKEENLLYDFSDKKAFFNFPFAFSFSPWVFGHFNVRLKNARTFYFDKFSPSFNEYLSHNGMFDVQYLDLNFPDRAFFAVDGPYFNVLLGRTGSGWGVGKSGNLLLGDHLDYYDNARIRFFNDYFSYTYQLTSFDTFFEHTPSSVSEDSDGNKDNDLFADEMRYFVSHRFEGRIFDRITIALSEGAMTQTETFFLQSLSPLALLHNQYNYGISNVSMAIDVEAYIGKGFNTHFQWISDQMSVEQEIKFMQNFIEPSAYGWIAGISYENLFMVHDTPLKYSSFLEFVLTDPYLYLEKGQPDQYAYYRAFDTEFSNINMGDGNNTASPIRKIAKPIGYVYGPDAIVVTFGNSIQFDKWAISPYLTYFLAGENNRALNYDIGFDALAETTPTGSVFEHNIIAETFISYKAFSFLEAYSHLGGIYSINHRNVQGKNAFDFQLTIGCTLQYDVSMDF